MTKNSPAKNVRRYRSLSPARKSPKTRSVRMAMSPRRKSPKTRTVRMAMSPRRKSPKTRKSPSLDKKTLLRKLVFAMKSAASKSSTTYSDSKFYKANKPRAGDNVYTVRVATGKHDRADQGSFYQNLSKEDEEWLATQ